MNNEKEVLFSFGRLANYVLDRTRVRKERNGGIGGGYNISYYLTDLSSLT